MNERIDVLAVMDAPISHAERFGAPRGFVAVPVAELRAARAAVAELIEANRALLVAIDKADAMCAKPRSKLNRLYVLGMAIDPIVPALRAALARVGGAA